MPVLNVKLISTKDNHIIDTQLSVDDNDTVDEVVSKLDKFSAELFRNRKVDDYQIDASEVTMYIQTCIRTLGCCDCDLEIS